MLLTINLLVLFSGELYARKLTGSLKTLPESIVVVLMITPVATTAAATNPISNLFEQLIYLLKTLFEVLVHVLFNIFPIFARSPKERGMNTIQMVY